MVIDRSNAVQINNLPPNIETVNDFLYLGSLITTTRGCEAVIRRRIALSRAAMLNLGNIWTDRGITKKTKMALVRPLVLSIFSYGSESWIIKAADTHRIDAFEMWCWRRMLRIPWTARRTNVSILYELDITDRQSTVCRRRILQYFGHITRRNEDNLGNYKICFCSIPLITFYGFTAKL